MYRIARTMLSLPNPSIEDYIVAEQAESTILHAASVLESVSPVHELHPSL